MFSVYTTTEEFCILDLYFRETQKRKAGLEDRFLNAPLRISVDGRA